MYTFLHNIVYHIVAIIVCELTMRRMENFDKKTLLYLVVYLQKTDATLVDHNMMAISS